MKIKFSLMCRRCNALAHDFVFDTENLPNIIGDPQSQLEIFNIELVASQSGVENDKLKPCKFKDDCRFDFSRCEQKCKYYIPLAS